MVSFIACLFISFRALFFSFTTICGVLLPQSLPRSLFCSLPRSSRCPVCRHHHQWFATISATSSSFSSSSFSSSPFFFSYCLHFLSHSHTLARSTLTKWANPGYEKLPLPPPLMSITCTMAKYSNHSQVVCKKDCQGHNRHRIWLGACT